MFSADQTANKIYIRPYARMGAYFIGVMFGMMYSEYHTANDDLATGRTEAAKQFGARALGKVKESELVRYLCFLLGVALVSFLV